MGEGATNDDLDTVIPDHLGDTADCHIRLGLIISVNHLNLVFLVTQLDASGLIYLGELYDHFGQTENADVAFETAIRKVCA